jgi:hypothetical protein
MPVEYSFSCSGHEPQDIRRNTFKKHHQEENRHEFYQTQKEQPEAIYTFKKVIPKPEPRPVGTRFSVP